MTLKEELRIRAGLSLVEGKEPIISHLDKYNKIFPNVRALDAKDVNTCVSNINKLMKEFLNADNKDLATLLRLDLDSEYKKLGEAIQKLNTKYARLPK